MKVKYEDAYCAKENKTYSIEEVAAVFHKDPARFGSIFEGNMLCPYCRCVHFSFVNAKHPHFRGYPLEEHRVDCYFATELMQPEEVDSLVESLQANSVEEAIIVRQIERMLIQFFKNNSDNVVLNTIHPMNNLNAELYATKAKGEKRMIPQKQINSEFLQEDFNIFKIFYGKVNIEWERDSVAGEYRLLIRKIISRHFICRLRISEQVYHHLEDSCKVPRRYNAFIVFFTRLVKPYPDARWYTGKLRRSTLLSINRIAEDGKHSTKRNG